jgi:hypothetical protein
MRLARAGPAVAAPLESRLSSGHGGTRPLSSATVSRLPYLSRPVERSIDGPASCGPELASVGNRPRSMLPRTGNHLRHYQQLLSQIVERLDPVNLTRMESAVHAEEALALLCAERSKISGGPPVTWIRGGWKGQQRVATTLLRESKTPVLEAAPAALVAESRTAAETLRICAAKVRRAFHRGDECRRLLADYQNPSKPAETPK